MWSLIDDSSSDQSISIPLPIGEVKVGRQDDCLVRIVKDQSVSRLHAIILIDNDTVSIKDCNSKFGTFVNGAKVGSDVAAKVQPGDKVRFGACASEYKLVVTKTDNMDSKRELAELLSKSDSLNAELASRVKRMDRRTLFSGMKINSSLSDLVVKCGGTLSSEGPEWTDEQVYDAIIYGTFPENTRMSLRATVSNVSHVPLIKAMSLSSDSKQSVQNVKNVKVFRKAQPMTVPDIIGVSEMTVHRPVNDDCVLMVKPEPKRVKKVSGKPKPENDDNPILLEHKGYTTKPIESFFTANKEPGTTDFESDFFKNLV